MDPGEKELARRMGAGCRSGTSPALRAPASGCGRMNAPESNSKREALEIELLAEAVFRCYGYDFREYAPDSLRRRIKALLPVEGLATISGLQEKVLHDPACLERLLPALMVNVTSLFRDPGFFLTFRNKVAPLLRTHPF